MARPEKVAVVEEIRTKLAESDAAVLTEYRGLTVHELADLRGSLRGSGTEYKVFKNTLARRAVEGAGLDDITSLLSGPVAIAFVRGDAAAAAKALRDFGKNNPALIVKGGLLGERVISPADIDALAELPSREVHAHADRGHVPGPAHQGGRSVPGVHPQLRVRRVGADRPAGRRRRDPRPRGPAAEAETEPDGPRHPLPRHRPRTRRPRPKHLQPRPRHPPTPRRPRPESTESE